MRRIIVITFLAFIFYFIEFVLFNLLGRWFTPNLLITLIIFFNLYLGIRYSLLTAVMAGIVKDSFGIDFFGSNIFSFVICAYLTTLIKRYLYQIGSISSRVLLIFLITILNALIHAMLNSIFNLVDFREMIVNVLFPEVLATTLMANYVWARLKKIVVKFSIK